MATYESRARGPAPERSTETATDSVPEGSVTTAEPALDGRRTFVAELTAQLRRRREASARLAPLADGRRDVLDVRPSDGRWP